MKLVEEIIDILSSANPDLETALTKAKVLASRLGEKDLLTWINSELVGYADNSSVPDYRRLDVTLFGTVNNGVVRQEDVALNPRHLPEDFQAILSKPVNVGVKAIQDMAPKTSKLQTKIPRELLPYFKKGFHASVVIEDGWGKFSEGAFVQILSEVKHRLLDFMLELSSRMPEDPAPKDMKQLSKDLNVGDIFKGVMFGHGATVNFSVGTNNTATQTVTQQSMHNNLDALIKELKDHDVPAKDILELKAAIKADEGTSEHENQDYGPKVKAWIGNIITKAAAGTAGLTMKVATGVAVSAISKYYDFK